MTIDLSKIFPKISDMSTTKVLIYKLEKNNLQTRVMSVPDYEKLPKEVDSG